MSRKKPRYGYYSPVHAGTPGCVVSVFKTPDKEQEEVTGFGTTEAPEESGYHFLQTRLVGKITSKWKLIVEYTVPGPIDPGYLLDPEGDHEEEYLAA